MAIAQRRVLLVQPGGICVRGARADVMAEPAPPAFAPPVYVRHSIVGNLHRVGKSIGGGARFVEQ